jgi:hypothetical protein
MTPKLVHPTMPTPSYVACAIYKVQTLLFPFCNHNILITFIIGTSMSYIRCALPFVQGAIDDAHISIVKHLGPFAKNYYFHKTSGYNMVAQAVVDCKKRFIDYLLTFLVVLMILEFLRILPACSISWSFSL